MKKKAISTIRQITGWTLVIIGVFGIALPFLQGIILIIVGLYILSLDSKWFRTKLKQWAGKDVRIAKLYERTDRSIRGLFGMEHDRH